MSKLVQQATDELREAILNAVGRAVAAEELPAEPMPAFTLEIPADRAHGDWSANAALVSAARSVCPRAKLPS
jgi:arginyl-tRNA synthetase